MFCTACAARNDRPNSACATCGARLDGGLARADTGNNRARRSSRGGRHRRVLAGLLWAPVLLLAGLVALGVATAVSNEARLEAAFQRGEAAAAAGDPIAAAEAFTEAGTYLDAPIRLAAANAAIEPLRAEREAGVAALQRGDHAAAIDLLLPVARRAPGLDDVTDRLGDARRGLADRLLRESEAAAGRRDWQAAETGLRHLAALDPANGDTADGLRGLVQEHGPLVVGRDRDIWLVGPDGSDATRLTDGEQALWPVWSPDRSRVAYLSVDIRDLSGDVALVVVRPGEAPETMARSVSAHAPPAWSPDGRLLAYTSLADYDPVLEAGPISIRTVDVETGLQTNLTGNTYDLAFNPVFSPDGAGIAFVAKERRFDERPQHAPGDVWLADAAGSRFTNLTDGAIADAWSVHWQPGGDLVLVYSLYGQSWYEPPKSTLHLVDPLTGATEVVDSGSVIPVGAPVWSPDGLRFAWVSGDRTLWLRDGGGDHHWEAGHTLSNDLTWAPDGSALLAPALDSTQPSAMLRADPLTGWGGAAPSAVTIAYDSVQPFVGPPQWSAPGVAASWPGDAPAGTGLDSRP